MGIEKPLNEFSSAIQSEDWSISGQFSYAELQEIRSCLGNFTDEYEILGSGSTRIVIGHELDPSVVYKISCIPSDTQNQTEIDVWRNGCENIPRKHLAEILSWSDDNSIIEMEYCRDLYDLSVQEFDERLDQIYEGYYEYTDEGAKDSWGFSEQDNVIKCRDYGRAISQ
jgi:hypothetical protein